MRLASHRSDGSGAGRNDGNDDNDDYSKKKISPLLLEDDGVMTPIKHCGCIVVSQRNKAKR